MIGNKWKLKGWCLHFITSISSEHNVRMWSCNGIHLSITWHFLLTHQTATLALGYISGTSSLTASALLYLLKRGANRSCKTKKLHTVQTDSVTTSTEGADQFEINDQCYNTLWLRIWKDRHVCFLSPLCTSVHQSIRN